MVLNKQPSPASGYIIVSCCVNDAQNAWVVYSNGDIFCINDVINVNDNWYKIPSDKISGKLTQISCDTRYNIYLTGVNDKGELYYANTNITTSPNWSKVPTAPKASYVSMNSDGTCQLITQDGRLLFSNGQIDKNPPFNIQNSTNGNKPKMIILHIMLKMLRGLMVLMVMNDPVIFYLLQVMYTVTLPQIGKEE